MTTSRFTTIAIALVLGATSAFADTHSIAYSDQETFIGKHLYYSEIREGLVFDPRLANRPDCVAPLKTSRFGIAVTDWHKSRGCSHASF